MAKRRRDPQQEMFDAWIEERTRRYRRGENPGQDPGQEQFAEHRRKTANPFPWQELEGARDKYDQGQYDAARRLEPLAQPIDPRVIRDPFFDPNLPLQPPAMPPLPNPAGPALPVPPKPKPPLPPPGFKP